MSTTISALRVPESRPPEKTIFQFLTADARVATSINAVAGKFMTADRFLRLAVNAVKKTPLLMKCDTQSVLGAFMASAALGLEPNTVQQQAFLIPYKKRAKIGGEWVDTYECQFQIGYRGFITLSHRSPHIDSLEAEAIHSGDLFDHMKGSESFLKYRKALTERGALVGAFCFARLESRTEMATVLPLDELHKIRSKSETYSALTRNLESAENEKEREKAARKLADTPWVMWEDDMAAKSAIKKASKQLPLAAGDAIAAAVALDNAAETNTIDLAALTNPDVVRSVVQDGEEPPTLEHDPSETAHFGFDRPESKPEEVYSEGDARPRATNSKTVQQPAAPTFDEVAQRLREAKSQDALDLAADQIRDVDHPDDQANLASLYRERSAALEEKPSEESAPRGRRRNSISAE